MGYNFAPGFTKNAGSFILDGLVAGDFDIVTKSVTLKAGTNFVRGHVLEAGTAGNAGKYLPVTTDANAQYILLEDVDATSADQLGAVAVTGQFNSNALTLGAGATLAGVTKALEGHSIFLSAGFAGGTSNV